MSRSIPPTDRLEPHPPVPGFEIQGSVGRGGMGVVYRAREVSSGRTVALKILSAQAALDPEFVRRFEREARAAAALGHPAVVETIRAGSAPGGIHYIVQEFVDGENFETFLRRHELGPRESVELLRPVVDALAVAHAKGIVHRDVKPGNLLLTSDGRLKLADFGIARLAGETRLTRTGSVMGTPEYMAPEQFEGDDAAIGPATDVYAMGGVLYTMFTGKPPFAAERVEVLLRRVLLDAPRPISTDDRPFDPGLESIVLTCLEKDPARRFPSARELEEALSSYLADPEESRARTVRGRAGHGRGRNAILPWASAALALAALAIGGVVALRRAGDDAADAPAAEAPEEPARPRQPGPFDPPREDVPAPDPGRDVPVRPVDPDPPPADPSLDPPEVPGFRFLRRETFECAGVRRTVAIYESTAFRRAMGENGGDDAPSWQFTLVPGGSFLMGAEGEWTDEQPVHRVDVPAFLIARTEVVQAVWDEIVWPGKVDTSRTRAFPALHVPIQDESLDQIHGFLRATGLRLPSEAEWEYACRAGSTTDFVGGDDVETHGWAKTNSNALPKNVALKPPNAFGLFDVHGNVHEWCQDSWHGDYREAPTDASAWMGGDESLRLARGGGFGNLPAECRSAWRLALPKTDKFESLGFRPACSIPTR